ncbi:hypothetical protein CDD82_6719 [Ophiocordyceps australis]|uniref:Fungal lipase-type domain-containing protein n=1 Tax=Ophiocordyceps australis TaxID=1399860 RepID=A0A2C5XG33_9HYPO|nr:hypothetical protein CDD82_6719 [Ophiocordyceps australis]
MKLHLLLALGAVVHGYLSPRPIRFSKPRPGWSQPLPTAAINPLFDIVTANQVSVNERATMAYYSEHSLAAYCNMFKKPGEYISCKAKCPSIQDRVIIHATFEQTGIGGYIAIDHLRHEIVVSFRGSTNIRNYLTDLQFGWSRCHLVPNCLVHSGFLYAWNDASTIVQSSIVLIRSHHPSYSLVFTGHSLGGAVATLAAAHLYHDAHISSIVFTYGSPRVGNAAFAAYAQRAARNWRVTHANDIVPRLPLLEWGFRHVETEYWLPGDGFGRPYAPPEMRRCEGEMALRCNSGTTGLDIMAHLVYFHNMVSCMELKIRWRRESQFENLTQFLDLEDKVAEWERIDREFAMNGRHL